MAELQTTLLEVDPSAPSTRRTTSKGIGAGDIVEIDKRGRRFHALVMELDQLDSGRFELTRPPPRLAHLLAHRLGPRSRRGLAQGPPLAFSAL